MALRALEDIVYDLCVEHIDAQNGEPVTHRDNETGANITMFRGKTYHNLTSEQVWSLKTSFVAEAYHRLCEALDYQNKLYIGLHPLHADDLLREMRKNIQYNKNICDYGK